MPSPTFLPITNSADLCATIAPWLAANLAQHALICGIAARLPTAATTGAWGGVFVRAGEPVLALIQTPPWPVIIDSTLPVDAAVVQEAWELFRVAGRKVNAVNGPVAWAEALAAAQGRRIVDRMDLRVHRLVGAPQLPSRPPGAARSFRRDEIPLIQEWRRDFSAEIGEPGPTPSTTEAESLLGSLLAWTVDARPVAMAARARPVLGGWSINSVFTPPVLRGRGYAGAVVHAVCAQVLAEGATYVVLNTDLANPISNHLYARIGFVPVCDQARITWESP